MTAVKYFMMMPRSIRTIPEARRSLQQLGTPRVSAPATNATFVDHPEHLTSLARSTPQLKHSGLDLISVYCGRILEPRPVEDDCLVSRGVSARFVLPNVVVEVLVSTFR